MNLDLFNTIFLAIQSIGIIAALFFTARQYKVFVREVKLQAYNQTVDRMYGIRTLLISDPDLHKLFDGGPEGDALKELENYKHFYLMKMILHMNQSLYLKIRDESPTNIKDNRLYTPWRDNLKTDLTAPGARSIWENFEIVRNSYDVSFQEEVRSILTEVADA